MVTPQWGLDLGYRYYDRIEYSLDGVDRAHAFGQFETGLIWQQGRSGARFQAIGGFIFSGFGVQDAAQNPLLDQFTPGFRLDADVSLPVAEGFRVFASGGYQGYYSSDMPNQWRWRYGLRFTWGERITDPVLPERQPAQETSDEDGAQIDPEVPEYMPRHLSQSLPSLRYPKCASVSRPGPIPCSSVNSVPWNRPYALWSTAVCASSSTQ